jgi:hypothetical protein
MSEKKARRSRVLEALQKQAEEDKAMAEAEANPLEGLDEAFGLNSE